MRRLAAVAAALVVIAGCATTIEEGDEPAPISGGVIVDTDVPATTEPIVGSAIEVLPEMATELSRLGGLIAEGGPAEEALARIEAMWARIRPEVEEVRPGLVNGIAATVELARTAVERVRPADADKAFRILTDIVDSFTGDG